MSEPCSASVGSINAPSFCRAGCAHACFRLAAEMDWNSVRRAWCSAKAASWSLILDAMASHGSTVMPRLRYGLASGMDFNIGRISAGSA